MRCPHTDRPIKAKGMCAPCYAAAYYKRMKSTDSQSAVPRVRRGRIELLSPLRQQVLSAKQCTHADRPRYAYRLCRSCYSAAIQYARRRETHGAQSGDSPLLRGRTPKSKPPAFCHPDRPVTAHGYCKSCYGRELSRSRRNGTSAPWETSADFPALISPGGA